MNLFKNQSGFASAIIILIVAVIIATGGAGYYFYKASQEQKEDEVVKPEQAIDEVVDWKTYQNEEYGYEVKYPRDIRYKEISVSGIEFAYPDQSFTDNTGIYAEMPLRGNASINIQIYKSSLFTDGYLSWVTKRKNINKESEITINGEKFKQVDVVWRLVNGGGARPEGTREIHTFSDKGGMIYDIVYRQPPAGIDKSEDYYKILSTFRFIE